MYLDHFSSELVVQLASKHLLVPTVQPLLALCGTHQVAQLSPCVRWQLGLSDFVRLIRETRLHCHLRA